MVIDATAVAEFPAHLNLGLVLEEEDPQAALRHARLG
jgi:hypothetical protein